jgi:hypothetical protein
VEATPSGRRFTAFWNCALVGKHARFQTFHKHSLGHTPCPGVFILARISGFCSIEVSLAILTELSIK